jgi:hypothetical protein
MSFAKWPHLFFQVYKEFEFHFEGFFSSSALFAMSFEHFFNLH